MTSRLRLASGLVLMAYVAMHLLNHAAGLISVPAMEGAREVFGGVWISPPGEITLGAAFAVHFGLGLTRLWHRRTWRMPAWEAIQLLLALAIPVLGMLDILTTRILHHCCGVDVSYSFVLRGLWPDLAWRQTIFTLVVWLHGCMGLHYWLRLKAGYVAWRPWLLALAVLIPTLGLLGFVDAGRAVAERATAEPEWLREMARRDNWPNAELAAAIYTLEDRLVGGFVVLVIGIVLVDLGRGIVARRRNLVRISYDGDRTVGALRGMTLLDASRAAGVPHAAVCGGRGRCSTCRVRVTRGRNTLPLPTAAEQAVLDRVGAEDDVRLACQVRLAGDIAVTRLLPAAAGARDVMRRMDPNQGTEREIVVLFADLRGFTRLAESRLPYDVVFILNRYFSAMGTVIEAQGGHVDKFVGDGIMALFGLDGPPDEAARNALRAAAAMGTELRALNRELSQELREPLRMGIGLHLGPAIVGELGWGRAVSLTAVGDTVNTASRLESMTKELNVELVLSEAVARRAAIAVEAGDRLELAVRGRHAQLPVLAVKDAEAASPALSASVPPGSASLWRRWLGQGSGSRSEA